MEVILFHDLLHCESEKPSHKQSVFRFGEDCGPLVAFSNLRLYLMPIRPKNGMGTGWR